MSDALTASRRPVSKLMRGVAWSAGTVLGSGFSPIAPGTAGSLATLLVLIALPASIYPWAVATLFVTATLVGPYLADIVAGDVGRGDPGVFVLDEFAGLCLAAMRFEKPSLVVLIACFFAFRAFDIIKPWPANRLDALPGGFGVVWDDVAAGAMAWIAVVAAVWLLGLATG